MGMKRRTGGGAEYQVFYCFYGSGKSVASERDVRMAHADIYVLVGDLEVEGDFLGIVDGNGTTVQMIYHADDDSYWVEIPDVERQGSHGVTLGFDELVDFVKALPREFSVAAFPQLSFQLWQDE